MPSSTGIEIVGIAAPTCAGKTTLVEELLRRMPGQATGMSMDEYDLYPTGSAAMEAELANPSITNWEDPALFDLQQFAVDLGQLSMRKSVVLQARSRESMAAGVDERTIKPSKVTIAEGVFALHEPQAREVMGLTIFVGIPLEVMVERRLATLRPVSTGNPWDDPGYIRGPMVEGTKKYVLPQRDQAQLVLDGLMPTTELADIVMDRLGQI